MICNIEYIKRNCECCGSSNFESIIKSTQYSGNVNKKLYKFENNIVICKNCGFVFISPSPIETGNINEYYESAYMPFYNNILDYDVNKRLKLIRSLSVKNGTILDFGSNIKSLFHKELEYNFDNVLTIDLNKNISTDFNSLNSIRNESIDVLSCYYVLEHISNIRQLLREFYRVLRVKGLLILEVPDLYNFPNNVYPFIFHEHVNHFTIENLQYICMSEGFKSVLCSLELCSMNEGFVYVCEKNNDNNLNELVINNYSINKSIISTTIIQISHIYDDFKKIWTTIQEDTNSGVKYLFWGVNDILLTFLSINNYNFCGAPPTNIVFIDSNPQKMNFFPEINVFTPDLVEEQIRSADKILIFTKNHSDEILESMDKKYDKRFHSDQIVIIGY